MLRSSIPVLVLGLTASLPAQSDDFGEWAELFNGKDLEGWHTAKPSQAGGENLWAVEDGALANIRGGVNDICTVEEFEDYELEIEYKIPQGGNSGVYLRGQIEIQIADSYRDGKKKEKLGNGDAGAVYGGDFIALENAQNPPGEWNKYHVLHIGHRITVWHNGVLIQDNVYQNGKTGGAMGEHRGRELQPEKGPLMLQGDHSKVWYRNIRIRPLFGEGWKPIWNGGDLSAFNARNDDRAKDGLRWEVEDHAFTNTATGGRGHDIWTDESFGNFLVYYAYRSDPKVEGGNSGFYLRDQWEIQILGSQGTGQEHGDGALYSKKAPDVEARHAEERWNHMFVKLDGMKVTVWQNGKKIHDEVVLDTRTDNDQVKTPDFSSAPFKIQGDHGKVWFSGIYIKPLPDTKA